MANDLKIVVGADSKLVADIDFAGNPIASTTIVRAGIYSKLRDRRLIGPFLMVNDPTEPYCWSVVIDEGASGLLVDGTREDSPLIQDVTRVRSLVELRIFLGDPYYLVSQQNVEVFRL